MKKARENKSFKLSFFELISSKTDFDKSFVFFFKIKALHFLQRKLLHTWFFKKKTKSFKVKCQKKILTRFFFISLASIVSKTYILEQVNVSSKPHSSTHDTPKQKSASMGFKSKCHFDARVQDCPRRKMRKMRKIPQKNSHNFTIVFVCDFPFCLVS